MIAVRGRAKVFLAGPPLVKAAIGEDASEEDLGGAEMHASISGLAEYLAEDDAHGIQLARELVEKLRWNDDQAIRARPSFELPRFDTDELCGLVPTDPRHPWDIRELIARMPPPTGVLSSVVQWAIRVPSPGPLHAFAVDTPIRTPGITPNAGPRQGSAVPHEKVG